MTNKLLLSLSFLFTILLPPAMTQAQSVPAFASRTPESGIAGKNFVIVIPLENNGTGAADNVTVTSATFGGIPLTAPSLPIPLGPWTPASSKQLVLEFPANSLVLGGKYLLTVRGTYQSGTDELGFAINRIVAVTTPDNPTLSDIRRWMALDAIRQESEFVSDLGAPASGQAMLSFVQGLPEFTASGVSADGTSVWATFTDGLQILVDISPSSVPEFLTDTVPDARALSETTVLRAEDVQRQNSTEAQTARSAAVAGSSGFPASSKFRLLNGFPGFSDATLLPQLASWLRLQNYEPVDGATASVAGLKAMSGSKDGIFMIRTHGGVLGTGTFGLWTSDVVTSDDAKNISDALATPAPLMFYAAEIRKGITEIHWAITSAFVDKYWAPGTFSSNSLVYIDACKSDLDPVWKLAIMSAGASVYAGWNEDTGDPFAANTARLVYDRLLGANSYCPETDPSTQTKCVAGKASPPIFPQRPFDYGSVVNTEYHSHRLGEVHDIASAFNGLVLNFSPPTPGAGFNLLAPSIGNMSVDEIGQGRLYIYGLFGSDAGKVSIDGQDAQVESWSANQLIVDLNLSGSGSAGDVQVTVRGHTSNVARVTEWRGSPFNFTLSGNGSLKQKSVYDLHFRADIRKWRDRIHFEPREPSGPFYLADDSTGKYASSGAGAGPSTGATYLWSGGGTLTNFKPTAPDNSILFTGTINSSTQLGATVEVLSFGSRTGCTIIVPGGVSTGGLSVSGPSNPFFGGETTVDLFQLDPDSATIQPDSFPEIASKQYPCTDPSVIAHSLFKWGPLPPTIETAPDPSSAR